MLDSLLHAILPLVQGVPAGSDCVVTLFTVSTSLIEILIMLCVLVLKNNSERIFFIENFLINFDVVPEETN